MTDRTPAVLVRTIGRWSLAALVLNSIIGSGVFALPGPVGARLGAPSLLAWLLATLLIGSIVACFAEVASRFTGAGGPYLYSKAAFGRLVGVEMGWMAYLVRLTAAATNVNVFTAYFGEFWGPAGGRAGAAFLTVVLLGILAAINIRGVRSGTRVSNVFAVAKMLPLLLFAAAGVALAVGRAGLATPAPVTAGVGDWLQVLLLLMFAFGGFEAALIPLGEAKDPQRDAPVALFTALGIVAAIYLLVQLAVLAALPDPGASTRPLAEAARVIVGAGGAAFMAFAALVSVYGYLASAMLNVPRLTWAMADRGDLPAPFARIHPVYRTPVLSIVVYAVLVGALAIQGSLLQNLSLSAVSRLATYGVVCVALLVLRRRDGTGDTAPARFRLPAGGLFATMGLVVSLVLATRMGGREAILMAAVLALGFVHWLGIRHRGTWEPDERASPTARKTT